MRSIAHFNDCYCNVNYDGPPTRPARRGDSPELDLVDQPVFRNTPTLPGCAKQVFMDKDNDCTPIALRHMRYQNKCRAAKAGVISGALGLAVLGPVAGLLVGVGAFTVTKVRGKRCENRFVSIYESASHGEKVAKENVGRS